MTDWVFESGRRYRVTQEFKDYDGDVHPVGEEWTFRRQAFLPYEDGESWFVSPDDRHEVHIRMQRRDESQNPILHDLARYLSAGPLAAPVAQYRFKFSDEFRTAASRRYQRARGAIFAERSWAIAIIFLAVGAAGVLADESWLMVPCVIGAGLIVLAWSLRGPAARRRFRSSPYRNDDVMFLLSEEGVHITGRHSEMRLGWPLLTKAVRFGDGLLLFQGPNVFNWLPDYAATTPAAVPEALRLARAHITDYREAR